MWEFIKHKLIKLGCFAVIGVSMILVTALTKVVLGWFDIDHSTKDKLSASAGEYFGMGVFGMLLLIGGLSIFLRLKTELRARQTKQPPHQAHLTSPSSFHPPQLPPPLPSMETSAVVNGSAKKKGCIAALVILAALPLLALGVIWHLASLYEKQPKKPGQIAVDQADDFISSYKGAEAGGNTPEATELGAEFARTLRVARGLLVQDGKPGFSDMTQGGFLTYCFLTDESVAFIVHVPGIRKFSDSAKLTLEEAAWTIATQTISAKHPQVKKMALGIKGDLDYSSIVAGSINSKEPLKGIETHHPTFPNSPLWPYFIDSSKIPPK